jgi:hypothetical protein
MPTHVCVHTHQHDTRPNTLTHHLKVQAVSHVMWHANAHALMHGVGGGSRPPGLMHHRLVLMSACLVARCSRVGCGWLAAGCRPPTPPACFGPTRYAHQPPIQSFCRVAEFLFAGCHIKSPISPSTANTRGRDLMSKTKKKEEKKK